MVQASCVCRVLQAGSAPRRKLAAANRSRLTLRKTLRQVPFDHSEAFVDVLKCAGSPRCASEKYLLAHKLLSKPSVALRCRHF